MANLLHYIEHSDALIEHFKFEVLNYGTERALFYPTVRNFNDRIEENKLNDQLWISHLCERGLLDSRLISRFDTSQMVTFTDTQHDLYLTQLLRCLALEVRQQLGRNSTSDSMIIPCVYNYIEQVTIAPQMAPTPIDCLRGTVTADVDNYEYRFVNRLLCLDYPSNWSYVVLQNKKTENPMHFDLNDEPLKRILALFSLPTFSDHQITWTVYLLKSEADDVTFKRNATDTQTWFYEEGLEMDMKMLHHAELDFIIIRDTCRMLNRRLPFRRVDVVLNPSVKVVKMKKTNPVPDFAEVLMEIMPVGQMFPTLNAEQMSAVACGVNDFNKPIEYNRVSIINGGPGTGKTFLVARLVKYLVRHWGQENDFRIIISAADNASVNRLIEEMIRIEVHTDLNLMHKSEAALVRLGRTTHRSLASTLEVGSFVGGAQSRYGLFRKQVKVAVGTPQSIALEKHLSEMFYRADPDDPDASQYIRFVIVDEYSQMSLAHTNHLFALPCTKFFFVGDCHKLPPTTISHSARELGYDRTYPGLLKELLGEELAYREVHLRDQYRMCPSIVQLPNLYTYGGELRAAQQRHTNPHLACLRSALVLRCDTTYEEIIDARVARGEIAPGPIETHRTPPRREHLHLDTFKNEMEATLVVKAFVACLHLLCRPAVVHELNARELIRIHQMRITFAILTFYHGQKKLINGELERYFGRLRYKLIRKLVTVNSVDGFNSYEADVVILSCTRGRNEQRDISSVGFLSMRSRLNVALTRARSVFIAVINEKRFSAVPELGELPIHFLHFTKEAEMRESLLDVAINVSMADLQQALSAQPLEAAQLHTGQVVAVSVVVNAESFFVQPDLYKVEQMFVDLFMYFTQHNVPNLVGKAQFIIRGQLLCIWMRGYYYRVQVLFPLRTSRHHRETTRFAVRYIDYGYLSVATVEQLYRLPPQEPFTWPPLAVHCCCCQNSAIPPSAQHKFTVTLHPSESDLKQAVELTVPPPFTGPQFIALHQPEFAEVRFLPATESDDRFLPLVIQLLNFSDQVGGELSSFTLQLTQFYEDFHEKAFATFNGDDIVVFKIANYALRGQVDGFKRAKGDGKIWRQCPLLRAIDFGFFISIEPKNIYQLDESRFGLEKQPAMGSVDDAREHWSTKRRRRDY